MVLLLARTHTHTHTHTHSLSDKAAGEPEPNCLSPFSHLALTGSRGLSHKPSRRVTGAIQAEQLVGLPEMSYFLSRIYGMPLARVERKGTDQLLCSLTGEDLVINPLHVAACKEFTLLKRIPGHNVIEEETLFSREGVCSRLSQCVMGMPREVRR